MTWILALAISMGIGTFAFLGLEKLEMTDERLSTPWVAVIGAIEGGLLWYLGSLCVANPLAALCGIVIMAKIRR